VDMIKEFLQPKSALICELYSTIYTHTHALPVLLRCKCCYWSKKCYMCI